jgi:Coenzyme PQQ synthesis protein D (PqqD)
MYDRPQARTEGVISELVADDLVIYDEVSQTAHSLSSAAASVWGLCDGKHSSQEIADQLSLELTIVERAVAELGECGLLGDRPLAAASIGISRREAGKRLAQIGGAVFAAPLIYSVAVPAAAAAASTCTSISTTNSAQCTASAGQFGTSSKGTGSVSTCCMTGACYQTASTSTYYCVAADDSCKVQGVSCKNNGECCGRICNGAPDKTCAQ